MCGAGTTDKELLRLSRWVDGLVFMLQSLAPTFCICFQSSNTSLGTPAFCWATWACSISKTPTRASERHRKPTPAVTAGQPIQQWSEGLLGVS